MPALYADENFPLPVVEELRRLGFDVVTMYEDGKANQSLPDEDVLSLASDKQRALLTANRRHFIRIHRRQADHGRIIVLQVRSGFWGCHASHCPEVFCRTLDHARLRPGIDEEKWRRLAGGHQ